MPLTDIPQEIVDEYNLQDIVTPHGWIYMEIRKALYRSQVYLPPRNSPLISNHLATISVPTLMDYGNTNLAPSVLHSLLMILVSSMSTRKTQNILNLQ